jgi:hypothetical protein
MKIKKFTPKSNTEPFAYLAGWIASKCAKIKQSYFNAKTKRMG